MTEHFKASEKIQLSEEEIANLSDARFKEPEIIQLSNEQIANLSDAQFKILVIRTLTELVEFGRKLDEKMKAMLRETKENVQGTNSEAKETGTQYQQCVPEGRKKHSTRKE